VFNLVNQVGPQQRYLLIYTIKRIIDNDSQCLFNYLANLNDLLMSQATHEEE